MAKTPTPIPKAEPPDLKEGIPLPVPTPGAGKEEEAEEAAPAADNSNNSPAPGQSAGSPSVGRAGKPGSAEDTVAWVKGLVDEAQKMHDNMFGQLPNSASGPQEQAQQSVAQQDDSGGDNEQDKKAKEEGVKTALDAAAATGEPDAVAIKTVDDLSGGQVSKGIADKLDNSSSPSGMPGFTPPGK